MGPKLKRKNPEKPRIKMFDFTSFNNASQDPETLLQVQDALTEIAAAWAFQLEKTEDGKVVLYSSALLSVLPFSQPLTKQIKQHLRFACLTLVCSPW